MIEVAMNSVATVMGSNVSTASSRESKNNEFQNMLNNSQAKVNNKTDAVATNNGKRPNTNEVSDKKSVDEKTIKKLQKLITKLGKITEKIEKDQEHVDINAQLAISEIITNISNLLNVSEDELVDLMASLDLTVEDLFDSENLQNILVSALGIEDQMSLLTNSEFNELFKEIQLTIESTVVKYNLDIENLEGHETLLETIKTESVLQKAVTEVETSKATPSVIVETPVTQQQQTVQNISSETITNIEVVQEQGASDNHSKGNEQSSEFMNQFTNVLENVVTEKVTTVQVGGFEQVIYSKVNGMDILQQIVTQMKVTSLDSTQTLSFQLQPENLGKIAFSITNTNGILTGSFVAENNAVKEAIELNLSSLKASLTEQGIKVDDLKVVVGNTNTFFEQQERQQQHQHARKQRRAVKIEAFDPKELLMEAEEELERYRVGAEEHSVEYSA